MKWSRASPPMKLTVRASPMAVARRRMNQRERMVICGTQPLRNCPTAAAALMGYSIQRPCGLRQKTAPAKMMRP